MARGANKGNPIAWRKAEVADVKSRFTLGKTAVIGATLNYRCAAPPLLAGRESMRSILLLCRLLWLIIPVAGHSEDLFVAVGYGGRRLSSRDGATWENDQRWSDEARDNDDVLFDVAYGLDRFIAVGGGAAIGHILSTRDGATWTELPQLKSRVATIAFAGDRFVAAHDAELLYSDDGQAFHPGQKLEWKGSVHARKSAVGDGEGGRMFVIIGDVDLWAEKDRVSWRAATPDGVAFAQAEHHTSPARDIAFGAGHFVVVGPDGLIETSHDGINWTRERSNSEEDFRSIIWTGVRFLAQGKDTWTSPDGAHWERVPRPIPCTIAWAREVGSILGIGFSWGGNIFHSNDLIIWEKLRVREGPSLNAVSHGARINPER